MNLRPLKKVAALMCAGVSLSWTGVLLHAQEIPKFPIVRIKIEGNTLLPQAELDAAVQPFIGQKRDFGDVQRAMEALEERYKKRGFTTVSVLLPEQVLEHGEVLLNVVEGKIKGLRITGLDYYDEDNIRASLPTLKPGFPPFIDDVSANLRIANENPAKKIQLRLQPGDSDEDIYAQIDVKDESPWKIGATLDNTGSAQTGRNRFGLSFQHANLWNRDHILTAQYQTSPERPGEVHVYSLSYRAPLYEFGDAIDFFATQSNVDAGTIAAGPLNLAITGRGKTFGTRYTLNLKRHGAYEQQLIFGLDYKQSISGIGAGAIELGNEIVVRPVSLQYSGRWELEKSEISLFANLVHNLPGGSKGEQADFDKARPGSQDDFTLMRFGLTASYAFENDWQVKFSGTGQWTQRPLIPGEQFGMGGITALRGFGEREISNDKGLLAGFELYTPELCQPLGGEHRCRLLTFYDNGTVYRVDPLAGEKKREAAASIGLGLRYTLGKNVAFQTDYGSVLQGGGTREPGDWRIHARLGVFF